MKQPLVPLAELPTTATATEGNTVPVLWDVEPGAYVNQDNIFFDTVQAARMLKVAGFCGMRVSQYVEGERHTSTGPVGIGGIGPDGALTAAVTGVAKKAPLTKGAIIPQDNEQKRLLDYQRPLLSVAIDRAETGSLIGHYTGCGMDRTAAWAKVYDKAIREEIIRSARELNIRMPLNDRQGQGWINLLPASTESYAAMELLTSGSTPLASPVLVYGLFLGSGMLINNIRAGWHALPERRWSVLPGDFQPDRFAHAYLYAKAGRLLVARA